MTIYARLKTTAANLATKYGVQYTFTHLAQGTYNPATGTQATTSTTYRAYCVRDEFNTLERQDGSIQVDDIKMIAEAASFAVDDTVSMDSDIYRIVNVKPMKPGPIVVAYELQLRK